MSISSECGAQVVKCPSAGPNTPETSAFIAVVCRLSIARSVTEVMEIITQAARTLLDADGITFVMRQGDFCFYAEEDAISPLWKGRRFPMNMCISGWCMLECKAAVIADIYQDARIPHDAYRPTFVRSLMMVPVCQEEPIAALGAYWARTREISASEVALLQSIADAASLAVAHVNRLNEIRELHTRESEHRLVSGELQHRFRNVLAVVQSVVSQSMRGDPDRARTINRRLASLANTDPLLITSTAPPANLRDLIFSELHAYDDGRVSLDGADIRLTPHQARTMALVFHELATNAVKYGAFSVAEGSLFISWGTAGDEFSLLWEELNAPPVSAEPKRGFGSYFIERMLGCIGGTIETEMKSSGVVHRLRFRLPQDYLEGSSCGNVPSPTHQKLRLSVRAA